MAVPLWITLGVDSGFWAAKYLWLAFPTAQLQEACMTVSPMPREIWSPALGIISEHAASSVLLLKSHTMSTGWQCSVLPKLLRNLEPVLKSCWALEKDGEKHSHRHSCPQES